MLTELYTKPGTSTRELMTGGFCPRYRARNGREFSQPRHRTAVCAFQKDGMRGTSSPCWHRGTAVPEPRSAGEQGRAEPQKGCPPREEGDVAKLAGDPPVWASMLGCWVARSPMEWEGPVSAGIWTDCSPARPTGQAPELAEVPSP